MAKKIINIYKNDKLIAKAKNIQLNYYSTSLCREFYIFDVELIKPNIILEISDILNVGVLLLPRVKKRNSGIYGEGFNLMIKEINYSNPEKWTVYGGIIGDNIGGVDYPSEYSQGVIDVYNCWAENKELEWYQLPQGISVRDYIRACHNYSTIATVPPTQKHFEVDFEHITTELEFSCCFAEAFLGKRAYMGRYLDSFSDCLYILYDYRKKMFNDKYIKLKYKQLDLSAERLLLVEEVEKRLKQYGFNIEVC